MKSQYQNIKDQVYEANIALPKYGVVVYNFGNVSAIDRSRGIIAIKPSGVLYDNLRPQDIVIVDMEHRIVEGNLNPSSDTKTHLVLYKHFKHIGGVVHTHSKFATAWAQAVRPIPVFGTTHADHLAHEIPCTQIMSESMIRGDYEEETGHQILQVFNALNPQEIEMVLVACHGPFTWGTSPEKAVYNAVILEELAQMACFTLEINPGAMPIKQSLIDKHYQRKHGTGAYYGQENSP